MGELIIPDVPDETIRALQAKASAHGRTLVQEVRQILEQSRAVSREERPYSTEERVAIAKQFLAEYPDVQPAHSAEERREGLM
jgi:plasmid stability protein